MGKAYNYKDAVTGEKKTIKLKSTATAADCEKVSALSRAGVVFKSEELDDKDVD